MPRECPDLTEKASLLPPPVINTLKSFKTQIADLNPSYEITFTTKTLLDERPHRIQAGLSQRGQQDEDVLRDMTVADIVFRESDRRFQGRAAVAVVILIVCLCGSYALYGLFFGLGRLYLWAQAQAEGGQ